MTKASSNTGKGVAALILLTALFASLSVLARYLNDDFTILQQVYLRVMAAVCIAAVVFRRKIRWQVIRTLPAHEWLIIAFRGFTAYVVGVALISKAANETLLGNVSFIAALPFVPLLGFVILGEKTTKWKVLFTHGSFLGVVLLSVQEPGNLLSWEVGDLYAVIATLGFALAYIARKWHKDNLNNQEMTALIFVFGIAFTLILSLCIGEGVPNLNVSWLILAGILVGGVLNVANLFLINYAFEHVDAVRAGNLLNLEAAWGLLFGLVLYQEWPSWRGLIGGCLIIGCVIGMNIYSRREEAKLAAIHEEAAKT